MSESCREEQTRWITTVIISSALQDHEISTVLQRQQHRVRYSESVETGSVIFPLSGIAFILSDTQDLLRTGEEEFSKRIQKFINIHRNSFLVLSAALHGPEEWNVMFRIQRRYSSPVPAFDCHSWPQRSDYCNEVFDLYLLEERPDMFKCPVFCPSTKVITINLDLLLLEAKLFIEIDFHGSRFLGSNLRVIPVHNPAETVKLMLTMAKITSKPQADDARCKVEMTKAQIIEKSPVWKMLQEYQSHCN